MSDSDKKKKESKELECEALRIMCAVELNECPVEKKDEIKKNKSFCPDLKKTIKTCNVDKCSVYDQCCGSKLNLGLILGVPAGILVVLLLVFFLMRKRK